MQRGILKISTGSFLRYLKQNKFVKKLKIIHIIPSIKIGGAERIVLDICDEINNYENCEVKLITFKNNKLSLDDKSFHLNIPSKYEPSMTYKDKTDVKNLNKFIVEYKPDIIHTHLWESEMLLSQVDIQNAIRFTHFHDNIPQLKNIIFPTNKKSITETYERKIFLKKNFNNFICISKDTLFYAKKNIPKALSHKIYFLKNAINYKKFHSSTYKSLNEINIINMGSFVPKKNQILGVKILNKLKEKGYKANLIFLGDGPTKKDVISYAKKIEIIDQIKFMGNISNVDPFLEKSNFYLHTAYYEPFGLVMLEAMAAGLPVVSLDGKGNRDFIVNGENGYIFKNQDPDLFAEQIIELFEKQKLYEKISSNGQKTAKNHDIINYVSKLLELYKESISSTN